MNREYLSDFKYVFFDFDGTLVDSISILFSVYEKFLSSLKVSTNSINFNHLNGLSLNQIIEYTKTKFNISLNTSSLLEMYKTQLKYAYENDVNPSKNAEVLLSNFSINKKLFIVTSGSKVDVDAYLISHNWKSYFSGYVFGDEITNGKPNPEIYNKALTKFNINVKDVFTIEDSINGVKASVDAGILTLGFCSNQPPERLKQAGAYDTFDDFKQLVK